MWPTTVLHHEHTTAIHEQQLYTQNTIRFVILFFFIVITLQILRQCVN